MFLKLNTPTRRHDCPSCTGLGWWPLAHGPHHMVMVCNCPDNATGLTFKTGCVEDLEPLHKEEFYAFRTRARKAIVRAWGQDDLPDFNVFVATWRSVKKCEPNIIVLRKVINRESTASDGFNIEWYLMFYELLRLGQYNTITR